MRYLILGAGPAGLTIANSIIARGDKYSDVIVLEKESEAGGLCRSTIGTLSTRPVSAGLLILKCLVLIHL